MAIIPSGKMKNKIRIEQDSGSARNSVGEVTQSWSELTTAFAQIRQMSGTELFEAMQKRPNSTHKLFMRYQSGINEKMRIKWNPVIGSTRVFYIESIENVDYENHSLVILAKETK